MYPILKAATLGGHRLPRMTSLKATEENTDVVIVGAGPTGLTLACDLARWGVGFKIVDKAPEPFRGSRGKGVQPRTIEVFDDLGAAEELWSRALSRLPCSCAMTG